MDKIYFRLGFFGDCSDFYVSRRDYVILVPQGICICPFTVKKKMKNKKKCLWNTTMTSTGHFFASRADKIRRNSRIICTNMKRQSERDAKKKRKRGKRTRIITEFKHYNLNVTLSRIDCVRKSYFYSFQTFLYFSGRFFFILQKLTMEKN